MQSPPCIPGETAGPPKHPWGSAGEQGRTCSPGGTARTLRGEAACTGVVRRWEVRHGEGGTHSGASQDKCILWGGLVLERVCGGEGKYEERGGNAEESFL